MVRTSTTYSKRKRIGEHSKCPRHYRRSGDLHTRPPRPLHRELPPAEPFPIDALGALLGPAARGIQDKIQAPDTLCAQSVLAAATFAVQGLADIELPTGQAKPISESFLTIAVSGERKTACDNEALRSVTDFEAELREQYCEERVQYENEQALWEAHKRQILNERNGDKESQRERLRELGPPPPRPMDPLLTCPEPTIEELCLLLRYGRPSLGVFSDEGGQFIGGHGMKEENKLKTVAFMSAVWDGEPIKRVRSGDGVVLLPGRRITFHLMAQPDVARRFLSDPVLVDQSVLSRFLLGAPETTIGTRIWRDPQEESLIAIDRYYAQLRSILVVKKLPLKEGPENTKKNELAPRVLPLSEKARRLFINFHDQIERQLAPGGVLDPVRGIACKLPEHATRLAAVLALVDDPDCDRVKELYLASGIELAQHYATEALRLFQAGATDSNLVLAERLLGWLHDGWSEPHVSLPDMYQYGPNAIRDAKTAGRIAAILEEHGWLIPVDGGAVVAGTRRKKAWRIVRS